MDYTEPLAISGFVITIFSLIASAVVIVLFWKVPEIRSNFFFSLGFHISFSDLLFSLSALYISNPFDMNPYLCKALGMGREFGWLATIGWTTIITWNIYQTVKENTSDEELAKMKGTHIMLCYLIPLIGSTFSGFLVPQMYGPSDFYCWISHNTQENFWITCLFLYIPLGIALILCAYWYYKTMRLMEFVIKRKVLRDFLKLLRYPLIMLLCNSGAVANGFYEQFVDSKGLIELQYYYIIIRQSQGLLNALVYLLNNEVRAAIKRKMRRHGNQEYIDGEGSFDVSFIQNIEAIHDSSREEIISKYFETKKTSIMDSPFTTVN